ncbi:hypothetical protein CC80DRAFT_596584 [Byssothecium circinans]|uniref:Fido domain-containing protein n=1 Tax=Byssothecium circinans TaxID=147558 RepID=A0A6A5TI30_9PLEO|nr:hypothetical protein CC80DRAFT_596584 [Byssothecium circinans]
MTSITLTHRFLTTNQIKRIYAIAIANNPPTQPSLLESAVQSPINTAYYENNQDLFSLAGILSTKILKNHAFSDGNKRTGLLSADMFMRVNGYRIQPNLLAAEELKERRIEEALVRVVKDEMGAEGLGGLYSSVAAKVD